MASDLVGCSQSHVIYPRTSRKDLEAGIPIMVRGEGVHLTDSTGKKYLDLVSGWTRPVHIGYGRAEMADTIREQSLQLHYFTPMQYGNPRAIELAAVLAEIAPGDIDRFLFICDGSEAVESALKLVKHYYYAKGERWRFKVISRRGAFHGVTGGALRVLGSVLPTRHMMEPLPPGTIFAESPYCYRCPLHLSYPSCELACARDIERLIEFEGPDQVMAFIGEPVQQVFGAYRPPREYWTIVREICNRYGILMIVDEVICGFGRTGKWFGIEHFDVTPDLMLMAKGISSGYVPLGALGATKAVVAPVENFINLQTYMNHPVACAAGLKNIEILKRENLVERSREMGAYMLDHLQALADKHPCVGEARGTGLWTALDLTTDRAKRTPFPAERLQHICDRAREMGVIIKYMSSALEFAPPLVIERSDLDAALAVLDRCLGEEEKLLGL
ncbi:MAG TPA: aspartate aminotransferase family protein [Candidatus Baltobacteraceae bacterium]|nr:aspartate aminotransferase family protein [Candidatus Baltobacteraceae bacterium]